MGCCYYSDCKVEKVSDFVENRENRNLFMEYVKKMVVKNWQGDLPQEIKEHLNNNNNNKEDNDYNNNDNNSNEDLNK